MPFLPRQKLLTLEELVTVAKNFVSPGVSKIRVSGGEPLIRHNILHLFQQLNNLSGLKELTLTTNGSKLDVFAAPLREAGVNRLNISLDSLRPDRFRELTRFGNLAQVLKGINAAKAAGFDRIKLNSLILKNRNRDEVNDLVSFALENKLDISFIEEMPLGTIDEHNRLHEFSSSAQLREALSTRYELIPLAESTGGPSRYWLAMGYENSRIGFISPHSENLCAACNRVRLSADGKLLLCLGDEHAVDLRAVLRRYPGDDSQLQKAIINAINLKPEKHSFNLHDAPQVVRFMNATGG